MPGVRMKRPSWKSPLVRKTEQSSASVGPWNSVGACQNNLCSLFFETTSGGLKKDKGLLGAAAQRADSHQMAHETEEPYKTDARAQTTAAPQAGEEGMWQPALASDSNYVMSRGSHGQSQWAACVIRKRLLVAHRFQGTRWAWGKLPFKTVVFFLN